MATFTFGTPWSGASPPQTPNSLVTFESDIAANLTISGIDSSDLASALAGIQVQSNDTGLTTGEGQFWYDTSSGGKTLKLHDGSSWIQAAFDHVGTAAVPADKAGVDHVWETDSERLIERYGGIYAEEAYAKFGMQHSSDGTGIVGSTGPVATLALVFENDGMTSGKDGLPIWARGVTSASNSDVWGANFITGIDANLTGVTAVGVEIDIQPAASPNDPTLTQAIGLVVNAWANDPVTGTGGGTANGIQVGGTNGGTWSNAFVARSVTATGAAFLGASVLDCAWGLNLNQVTGFSSGAIGLKYDSGAAANATGADGMILLDDDSGNSADRCRIFVANNNDLIVRLPDSAPTGTKGELRVMNNAGSANLARFGPSGWLDLGLAAGEYRIAGTRVVDAQKTGWADATETADRTALTAYSPQTITGPSIAEVQNIDDQLVIVSRTLAAVINDLFSHGLIGA